MNNESFKEVLNQLDEYIKTNTPITRKCEVNYYKLEDRLKDLKNNFTSEYKASGKFRDSVDIILSEIYMFWYDVELLKEDFNKLQSQLTTISKTKIDANTDLKLMFADARILVSSISLKVDVINKAFNEFNLRISSVEKEITNDDKTINSIASSPSISGISNKYSPSLAIQATAKFGSSYNELGLFTGGLLSNNVKSVESMYFPELSNFSIYYKGSKAGIKLVNANQKTGINYEVYYMTKQFGEDSILGIDEFTYQAIQLKAGFEYVIYNEIISMYGNINFHMPITNKDNIRNIIGKERTDQVNIDAGIRMMLNPSQQSNGGTKLFVDLNMVFLNNTMQDVIKTKDNLLPNLKIGIQQRLTKF